LARPFATCILLTQLLACARQHLLGLKFLSFGFKSGLPAFAKMSEEKIVAGASKLSLSEEMHLGFLESMSKTNTENIVKEDRPWRPSHSNFGKSTNEAESP
jgi:hypothetical protein